MDPNQILDMLLQAVSDYEDTVGNARGAHIDAADNMRDAVRSLDDWLRAGGFLPADWNRTLKAEYSRGRFDEKAAWVDSLSDRTIS